MSVADPNIDFYHVNRRVHWAPFPFLKPGDEIDVGGQSNPYFRFFETERKVVQVNLSDGSQISSPIVKFLGAVTRGQATHPNVAALAYETVNHFVTYVRELLWEDVRKKEFPHLPSRQRCLWLIPSKEGVNYWQKRLGASDYQIVKVRVQGRIHKANELYLLGDSEPMNQSIQNARLYWLGVIPEGGQEELIFEGRVKVIEAEDLQQSSP